MNAVALECYPNQRRHPRHPVKWQCRLDLGKQAILSGVVRDHSQGGLCFQPDFGFENGVYYQGATALELLEENDKVTAVCVRQPMPLSKKCRVRWMGRSQAHNCNAIGLEFETE